MALSAAPAASQNAASQNVQPTVVELFTSQGCYSCPPAEEFLGELAVEKTLLALEFHVDYWDDLVYGSAGKWKDAFSKRAYTDRQTGYNMRIRKRPNVYTPQMVIDGHLEAVGSRRLAVLSRIRAAEKARGPRLAVDVSVDAESGATVRLAGTGAKPAGVWLVRFLRERRTEVLSGENKGKSLLSRNIVTELRRIGDWRGRDATITVSDFVLKEGEGCAVLVQDDHGPIVGAAPCEMPTS